MDNKYSQTQIIDLLNSFKGDDEFWSSQCPNMVEALKEFLDEKGVKFENEDFLPLYDKTIDVDSDGCPCIVRAIRIIPVEVFVVITAFHHKEWDFYIYNARCDKKMA